MANRRCFPGFLILLAAFVAAMPARAEDAMIVPADPWQIIHIAREFGPAEVGRDGMRDPAIKGRIGDLDYEIAFYGCYLGRDCSSVLFQARLGREDWKPDPDDIQDWNSEKLFGRAWLEDEDRAVLDHPVAMSAGIPKASLFGTFEAWQVSLTEFSDHLDF